MYKKTFIAVVLIGIFLSYFLLAGKNYCPVAKASALDEAQVQPLAPGFTLPNMKGDSVSLADYRGKVVVLNFWASWCPPCRAEMPSMEQLYKKMKGNDFELLAVNVEKNGRPAVTDFIKKIPVSFPVLLDDTQHVSGLYQVSGLPQTVIINKQGEIVQQFTGGRDWNSPEIREYITSLMKGE